MSFATRFVTKMIYFAQGMLLDSSQVPVKQLHGHTGRLIDRSIRSCERSRQHWRLAVLLGPQPVNLEFNGKRTRNTPT